MINCHYPLKIALVAGEASGDMLGAGLIRALKALVSDIRFVGIAGPLMQAEGCEAWYKMEELSVMGIVEILFDLRRLLYIRSDLTDRLIQFQPDVFIGIDSPDFNLTLENNLKRNGIKTIHYVSPSIWIWRKKRILKIKQSANLVLVLFPFEKKIYDKLNIPCRFIGHAMADFVPMIPDKRSARDFLDIPHNALCLALLPGSRITEIEMLSSIFLKAAKNLQKIYPELRIIVPLVNARCQERFKEIKYKVEPNLHVHLLNGKGIEAMISSDLALLASGTATLECMLAKCPMVVGYRMKPFTFWIAKRLIKTEYISLPNLLSGQKLVKELIQKECHPKALSDALLSLFKNDKFSQEIHNIFCKLHKKIRCNANEQAANAVLELIKQ